MTRFAVVPGDVTLIGSDLLVLRYAQAFYGADMAVVWLLAKQGRCQLIEVHPRTNQFVLVDTRGAIAPRPWRRSGRSRTSSSPCPTTTRGWTSARSTLGVVRDCGYIREMTGQTSFAGEIMERVRRQIESARPVIAHLNEGREAGATLQEAVERDLGELASAAPRLEEAERIEDLTSAFASTMESTRGGPQSREEDQWRC
jgi:hypothetical protein